VIVKQPVLPGSTLLLKMLIMTPCQSIEDLSDITIICQCFFGGSRCRLWVVGNLFIF